MAFQELAYPRRKNFIKNLNILLESKPVHSPQKQLAIRLSNFNSTIGIGLKTQTVKNSNNILTVTKDNLLLPKKRLQLKVVNQQNKLTRKGIFKSRYSKSAHQLVDYTKKISHEIGALSPQYEPTNTRSINTQRSQGGKIIFNANDQNNQELEMFKSSQFSSRTHQPLFISRQIKRNSQGLLYDYKPREERKKEFLKKGHRIKTNIIQNLIKSKLLSKNQLSPIKRGVRFREEQERLQNGQILRLIKLFKGTVCHQMELRPKNAFKFDYILGGEEIKGREKESLELEGWFNQNLSYEQNESEMSRKQKSMIED